MNKIKTVSHLTTQEREAIAVDYLKSLETGFLPEEIFTQMARLAVINTVEVGFVRPIYEIGQPQQVLLTQRPSTDKFWPNQWHVPGSVVRASDPVEHEHDYDMAISRVKDEIGGGLELIGNPQEFETLRRTGPRGSEITVRMIADATGDPQNGEFFDAVDVLKNPPKGGLLGTHDDAIAKIAAAQRTLLKRNK